MSGLPPNFRIRNDSINTDLGITGTLSIPKYSSLSLPPTHPAGSVIYDNTSQRLYYSDGNMFIPLQQAGASGTNIDSFSIILNTDQNIISGVETTLLDFIAPVPYSTVPEWNLGSGVYTANTLQKTNFSVNVEWSGGVTNLGKRYIRIYLNGGVQPVKEESTQADPNKLIPTSQNTSVTLTLSPGDYVEIKVFQDSGLAIPITQGFRSGISGFKIF